MVLTKRSAASGDENEFGRVNFNIEGRGVLAAPLKFYFFIFLFFFINDYTIYKKYTILYLHNSGLRTELNNDRTKIVQKKKKT